jgi:hypothetical protein
MLLQRGQKRLKKNSRNAQDPGSGYRATSFLHDALYISAGTLLTHSPARSPESRGPDAYMPATSIDNIVGRSPAAPPAYHVHTSDIIPTQKLLDFELPFFSGEFDKSFGAFISRVREIHEDKSNRDDDTAQEDQFHTTN